MSSHSILHNAESHYVHVFDKWEVALETVVLLKNITKGNRLFDCRKTMFPSAIVPVRRLLKAFSIIGYMYPMWMCPMLSGCVLMVSYNSSYQVRFHILFTGYAKNVHKANDEVIMAYCAEHLSSYPRKFII